jgi:hypothetical protein
MFYRTTHPLSTLCNKCQSPTLANLWPPAYFSRQNKHAFEQTPSFQWRIFATVSKFLGLFGLLNLIRPTFLHKTPVPNPNRWHICLQMALGTCESHTRSPKQRRSRKTHPLTHEISHEILHERSCEISFAVFSRFINKISIFTDSTSPSLLL